MIEELTSDLPFKVREQILIEYTKRLNDIRYLTSGKFDYYTSMNESIESIKVLLALSIFYKRILTNFESANRFTSRVVFKTGASGIQLGTYELTKREIFKINEVVLEFKIMLENYSIPISVFEYMETKEFLRKVKKFRDDSINQIKDNG